MGEVPVLPELLRHGHDLEEDARPYVDRELMVILLY